MDLPNLIDYDIYEHMPQNITSRYFTFPKLSSLHSSSRDFSIIHTNIRSLSLHHDELVSLSAHTNLNLAIIGVSEIHSVDNTLSKNAYNLGYVFFKRVIITEWWCWLVH